MYLFIFILFNKKRTSLIAFHKSNLPIMLKTLYFFMLFVQQASLRKFRLFSPDLFINLGRKYFALRGWECLAEVGRLSKKKEWVKMKRQTDELKTKEFSSFCGPVNISMEIRLFF